MYGKVYWYLLPNHNSENKLVLKSYEIDNNFLVHIVGWCIQLGSFSAVFSPLRNSVVSSRAESGVYFARVWLRWPLHVLGVCAGSRSGAGGSAGASDAEEEPPPLRRGASLNPARIRGKIHP